MSVPMDPFSHSTSMSTVYLEHFDSLFSFIVSLFTCIELLVVMQTLPLLTVSTELLH